MKLKTIMLQKNISQRDLERMTKITAQDISAALSGKKPFFPGWREKISSALGMKQKDVFPEYVKHDPVLERAERAEKHLNDAYHYLYCETFEKSCDEIADCGEKLVKGCYTCPQSFSSIKDSTPSSSS